jgi:hypothetical protein
LSDDLDWENLDNKCVEMDISTTFQSVDDGIDELKMIRITNQNGYKVTTETAVASSETDVLHAAAN